MCVVTSVSTHLHPPPLTSTYLHPPTSTQPDCTPTLPLQAATDGYHAVLATVRESLPTIVGSAAVAVGRRAAGAIRGAGRGAPIRGGAVIGGGGPRRLRPPMEAVVARVRQAEENARAERGRQANE